MSRSTTMKAMSAPEVQQLVDVEPVELVHAALIFEHAGIVRCPENAGRLVAAGGGLSVVLQLASESHANVAPTTFASMQNVCFIANLSDARNGFRQAKQAADNAPYQALATDWFSSARFFSSIDRIRLSISLTWA